MQRDSYWSKVEEGRIVHLVGRVTEEVFSFLGPATNALADSGIEQTMLAVDDSTSRHLLLRLHESVNLVLTRNTSNPLQRWHSTVSAMRSILQEGPEVRAVHLHGFMPGLIAPYVMRSVNLEAPLLYSPHSSKALGSLRTIAQILWWMTRPLRPYAAERGIANVGAEARGWTVMSKQDVELVETPVDDLFFETERNEALAPLILTGSRLQNLRSAELLAQLAVLLSDDDIGLSFNWIGPTAPDSLQRLKAANVRVLEVPEEAKRAALISRGWIYFAPSGTRGFPSFLVEAMASGLPCIAVDTPYHRDLIREGDTGYLCKSAAEVMERVVQLVESASLRQKIGGAAREEARHRFSDIRFRDSLLGVYERTTSRMSAL